MKGAVERVLELCESEMAADGHARTLDADRVAHAADKLAHQGLRVLATAEGQTGAAVVFEDGSFVGTLVFTGLQAMLILPDSQQSPRSVRVATPVST